ncbi:4-sulfomuconolactone hydrolase [Colletotrichum spaethianum]|uniref:4-sulfomuconolactone hydrolase n=1 Tax=Colletotrichum spaethianum TaxID=700344 RepID=A0AA37P716_9PEZI|nr:4-sulfomuconolactone hydrolase [Colletotrichum spaethianum]GKT41554.1 4-sulfomuconolactone hydrolase [Colletotrichum spaethianum]
MMLITQQPGFDGLTRLARDGNLWVKLSAPYRNSEDKPGYYDAKSLVRAFMDANKHQVIWDSDWPHISRMKMRFQEEAMKEPSYLEVDDAAWLKSLKSWLSAEEWGLMMIRNSTRLFRR